MATESKSDLVQEEIGLVRIIESLASRTDLLRPDGTIKLYAHNPQMGTVPSQEVIMELRPYSLRKKGAEEAEIERRLTGLPHGRHSRQGVIVSTFEYYDFSRYGGEPNYVSSIDVELPSPDEQRLGVSGPAISSHDGSERVNPYSDRHYSRIQFMQEVAEHSIPVGQIGANVENVSQLQVDAGTATYLKEQLGRIFSGEEGSATSLQRLSRHSPLLAHLVIQEIMDREIAPLVRAGVKAGSSTFVLNRHAAMLQEALGPDKFSDLVEAIPPGVKRRESGKKCAHCGTMFPYSTAKRVPRGDCPQCGAPL